MVVALNSKISTVRERLKHFDDIPLDQEQFKKGDDELSESKGFFARDFGMEQWDWPQGVGIYGLHLEGSINDEYIKQWALKEITKGLPTKNVNTVCPLLTLMDYPEYEALALEWMKWIESDFPRTSENGLQHITSGSDKFSIKENWQQIWVDTIFMTVLFMGKMGVKYDNQKWREDAIEQVLLHSKYLLNRETGLFYHGWNFNEQSNYGGNFWCRGNSWITIGIPLFLTIMEGYLAQSTKSFLINLYNNQVKTLLNLRSKEGLWHTILSDPTSYTETSGSAGIIAGILFGLKKGFLTIHLSEKDVNNLVDSLTAKIADDGTVVGVSAGTPISNNSEDYKEIVQMPMVYGQAMTLLALTIAESLKEKEIR
ncbi:glycoside hydrolase family 88/105 protein [Enterococcus asini]|uniref:Glycoside hydrolase family 88 protein n=1 Tax=Enterococcus asini TaxID=57732 RepID=A0AAW8TX15_9ENTE|nr:glycoside hydrolase family 88 protein [Enterococcus asini]MDT2808962.1 glycoside hydrolase family 88 protein [Enterococcus asini]